MKDSRALSSVQALDDYFDALLDDDSHPQAATRMRNLTQLKAT